MAFWQYIKMIFGSSDMNKLILTISMFVAIYSNACASSQDAWASQHKLVEASCVKASGLRNARPTGNPMDFDDRVGYTALMIQGHYPQPHMKNKVGRVLCLFDKQSRTPYVAEADSTIESIKRE